MKIPDGRSVGGTHFIVLIDDSGDMRSLRSQMIRKVPEWLFRGAWLTLVAFFHLEKADPLVDSMRIVGPAAACRVVFGALPLVGWIWCAARAHRVCRPLREGALPGVVQEEPGRQA